MALLIPDMKMPKNCHDCVLSEWEDGEMVNMYGRYCRLTDHEVEDTTIAKDCPLIEVPENNELVT